MNGVEREWKKGGGGGACKGGMRFDFVVAEVHNFSSKASLNVKVGALDAWAHGRVSLNPFP